MDNKPQSESSLISLGSYYTIAFLILEVICLGVTSTLLSFILVKQYGVFYSSPFLMGTCTEQYFMSKYSIESKFVIIFASVVSAIVSELIVLIIWVFAFVNKQIKQNSKNLVILLLSFRTWTGIISAGYTITFIIEFNKVSSNLCSITYDKNALILICSLAAASFIISLTQYISLLVQFREAQNQTIDTRQKQSFLNLRNNTHISEFNDSIIVLKDQGSKKKIQKKEEPIRQKFNNSKNTNIFTQFGATSINQFQANINVLPQKIIAKNETPKVRKQINPTSQRISVVQSLKVNILPLTKNDQQFQKNKEYLSQSKIQKQIPESRQLLPLNKRSQQSPKQQQHLSPNSNNYDDPINKHYDETIFHWPQSQSSNSQYFFHPEQSFSYKAITNSAGRHKNHKYQQIKQLGLNKTKSYKSHEKLLEIIPRQVESKEEINYVPKRNHQNYISLKASRQIIQNYQRKLNKL